jgi:hypothetical protein
VVHSENEKNSSNFSSFFPSDGKFRPEDPECHGSANGKLQQSVREAFDDVFGEKKRRAAIFRSDGLRCSTTRTVFQPLFQSLVNFGPSGRQLRPCFGFFFFFSHPERFRMIFRPHPDVLLVR